MKRENPRPYSLINCRQLIVAVGGRKHGHHRQDAHDLVGNSSDQKKIKRHENRGTSWKDEEGRGRRTREGNEYVQNKLHTCMKYTHSCGQLIYANENEIK